VTKHRPIVTDQVASRFVGGRVADAGAGNVAIVAIETGSSDVAE
jgi:hypothetical protein